MLCVDGAWTDSNNCVGAAECNEGATQDGNMPCGLNNEGVYTQNCVEGTWANNMDDCTGTHVCTNGETQDGIEACGENDAGVFVQLCEGGDWVYTDECTVEDAGMPILCTLSGDAGTQQTCTVNVAALVGTAPATALQFDAVFDTDLVSFSGLSCPVPAATSGVCPPVADSCDLCAGTWTYGAIQQDFAPVLPSGHSITKTILEETLRVMFWIMQEPAPVLTEAEWSDGFLVQVDPPAAPFLLDIVFTMNSSVAEADATPVYAKEMTGSTVDTSTLQVGVMDACSGDCRVLVTSPAP
jgi:hypothetical protein